MVLLAERIDPALHRKTHRGIDLIDYHTICYNTRIDRIDLSVIKAVDIHTIYIDRGWHELCDLVQLGRINTVSNISESYV